MEDGPSLERRLREHHAVRAVAGPYWSGTESVGLSGFPAGQASLDALVHVVDQHMYLRRTDRSENADH
jgi:hypothetical protein